MTTWGNGPVSAQASMPCPVAETRARQYGLPIAAPLYRHARTCSGHPRVRTRPDGPGPEKWMAGINPVMTTRGSVRAGMRREKYLAGLFRPIPDQSGSRGARPQKGKKAAEPRAPSVPQQPALSRPRPSCRNLRTGTPHHAPHHGPGCGPGNRQGVGHIGSRAAKQTGTRDRAPRRKARKPSERSSRPAPEGNERVLPGRRDCAARVARSQASGASARR